MPSIEALDIGFSPWQLDAMQMKARVVVVGECVSKVGGSPFDGRDRDGRERRGGSGWRFARLLGTTPDTLRSLPSLKLTNLFPEPVEKWDQGDATIKAINLMEHYRDSKLWILLGRRVADAFSMEKAMLRPYVLVGQGIAIYQPRLTFINVPHPSGRNLFWNSEYQRRKAKKLLRVMIGEALSG